MTTASDLIHETRGHLLSGVRDRQNTLAGSHNSSVTTFTFTYDLNFAAGDVLAVDLELVYVWSTSEAAKTAVVQRGFNGSTAATHADLALVTVSPSFSDFRIFQALNAELRSLSSPGNGLFQMKNVSVTYNAATVGYDLTSVTDVLDIWRVYYDEVGPDKLYPEIKDWHYRRNMPTTDFASGHQIIVTEAQPGNSVRVLYKAPFTVLSTVADDVQTVSGLPATANDLPPLGAALRLGSFLEVQRNLVNSQGDTRRANEVPQGAQLRATSGLMAVWTRRVEEEKHRLSLAYPHKRR